MKRLENVGCLELPGKLIPLDTPGSRHPFLHKWDSMGFSLGDWIIKINLIGKLVKIWKLFGVAVQIIWVRV